MEFSDDPSHDDGEHHLFVGLERGERETPAGRIELHTHTSLLFVCNGDVGGQGHHHGSIEQPALLAAYQTGIFGQKLSRTT